MLYKSVPATWWAPYGGRSPLMLQFTSSATVAGVSGQVDCSAFLGTAAQLASHVLPKPPAPPAPPAPAVTQEAAVTDTGSLVEIPCGGHVNIPVANVPPSSDFRIVVTGDTGTVLVATAWFTDGGPAQQNAYPLNNGRTASVVFRKPWNGVSTVRLARQDTKTSLAASAFVRF